MLFGPVYDGVMALKASSLRENIYRILDQVLETGVPVEIERRGKILKIVPAESRSKLENLKPQPYVLSDPEELVHHDWSGEWPELSGGNSLWSSSLPERVRGLRSGRRVAKS